MKNSESAIGNSIPHANRKLVIALFALMVVSFNLHGQTSEKYKYLYEAAEQVRRETAKSARPDLASLQSAFGEACKALDQLRYDGNLEEDLRQLAEFSGETQEARNELSSELILFIDSFLRVEERWLVGNGISSNFANEILWSASAVREAIANSVEVDDTLDVIEKMRDGVCEVSENLQDESDLDADMSTYRKWSFRLGGTVLIAVDAAAFVTSGGTVTPVAVGSVAIGSVMSGWD